MTRKTTPRNDLAEMRKVVTNTPNAPAWLVGLLHRNGVTVRDVGIALRSVGARLNCRA